MTDELDELDELEQWIKSRPEKVQEVIRQVMPGKFYIYKETGQLTMPIAYNELEDDTIGITVNVIAGHNQGLGIFGLKPKDFEEYTKPFEEYKQKDYSPINTDKFFDINSATPEELEKFRAYRQAQRLMEENV